MNFDAIPIKSEQLSPQEFLNLTPLERANISETRIVPPKLGEDDFGKIEVNYKDPIYQTKHG